MRSRQPERPTAAQVHEVAKVVERLGDDLSFKHALALARLVLERGGGPVPRRGRRAPIDSRTVGVLERRGYVEQGGDQGDRRVHVESVLNLSPSPQSWTTTAGERCIPRLTTVVSASDEGIELVGEAWKQACLVDPTLPTNRVAETPAGSPAEQAGPAVVNEGQGSLDLFGMQAWDLFDSRDELATSRAPEGKPEGATGLEVRPGAEGAEEVVLLAAWCARDATLLDQLAIAWAEAWGAQKHPWIALAWDKVSFDKVHTYLRQVRGKDDEHDRLMDELERQLPLDRCALTSVQVNPGPGDYVDLWPDPPYEHHEIVHASRDGFQNLGLSVDVPDLTFEMLFDRHFGQVLGWDDIYSPEQWDHLCNAARLRVVVPETLIGTTESIVEFAKVIPDARRSSGTPRVPSPEELALIHEEWERDERDRYVAALIKPLNNEEHLNGFMPETATLPAFDGQVSLRPPSAHILDQCVRLWADLDADDLTYAPSPGTVALSSEVPRCDYSHGGMFRCQMAARYDMPARTRRGAVWGNYCPGHARELGLTTLGTGLGQYLLHPDELTSDERDVLEHELGLLDRLSVLEGQEAAWSRLYRSFGFAALSGSKLVKRTDTVTIWAERAPTGGIGLRKSRARSFSVDNDYDRTIPEDWPADRVREVLFGLLAIDHHDKPGTPAGLGLTLDEAESAVRDGLASGTQTAYLRHYLNGDDRGRFNLQHDKTPFQHASEIVVANSTDWGLLTDVYQKHADALIRAAVLRRDGCPESIHLLATNNSHGRNTLLGLRTLSGTIAAVLFDKVALSSAAAEERGVMLRAATHAQAPIERIEGLAEKALFERDDRLALLDAAAGLDAERRHRLWMLVLHKTHRGKLQDEVMWRILGDRGLENVEVISWLGNLPNTDGKHRALRWVRERATAQPDHFRPADNEL